MALSPRRQLLYWTFGLAVLLLAIWRLADVLLPFVVGLALAYLLDPLADRLERWGCSRVWATAIISFLGLSSVIVVIVAIVPFMFGQLSQIIALLPEMATTAQDWLNRLLARFAPNWLAGEFQVTTALQDFGGIVGQVATTLGERAVSLGLGAVNLLLFIIIVPVVMVYMLADWDRAVAVIDSWLPRDHVSTLRQLGHEIDRALAGFVRGQLTVCVLVGVFYAALLELVGLNFGFTIGILAGLLSFIPLFGAIAGGALAAGVAAFQFWSDPIWIAAVVAIFLCGQVLEGNILTPRLVGRSVGLHPVWLLFALSAFGSLFGFIGMLLAVPMAAVVGVIARHLLKRYLTSSLYRGQNSRDNDE
ncbi:MAG: AI-2E family transporter [Rhodobacteraceae bacterium]|nr:AI-2E family transporter [Paracoccaceae bacterium]